jgi:hypothetical protein
VASQCWLILIIYAVFYTFLYTYHILLSLFLILFNRLRLDARDLKVFYAYRTLLLFLSML